ncbi:MAG: NAD(P)H-dependent oxidoreductase [Rhodospirillales bacterium]|nr:NAD(P)H-dependent oxidoreductase [Rhodospirillales bacterium]
MKILTVIAHPNEGSFTHALMNEFISSAKSAGNTVDVADLYAEGFDPCFNMHDIALYGGTGEVSDKIANEHKRVMDTDAIALFFPIWWWSMPAMLKGWVDRVFTSGFAFTFEDGNTKGLLTHRKAAMFCPAASDHGFYRRYGYHNALQRQNDAGVFGYCGIADVETHIFPNAEGSDETRASHLAHARQAGQSFAQSSSLDDDIFG